MELDRLLGIKVAVGVVRETLAAALSRACAWPLVAYAAVRAGAAALLFSWFREPLAGVLHPLLVRLWGEPATHFPNDVPAILTLLVAVNAILDLVVGSLAQGALVFGYCTAFLGRSPLEKAAFRAALSRYGSLFLLSLLSFVVLVAGGAAFRGVARALGPLWPLGRVETEEGSFLFAALLTLPMIFAPAALLLKKTGVVAALRASASLFARRPLASLLLLFPLLALFLPAGWVMERADAVIELYSRTAVLILALGEAALAAATLSLVTGIATRYLLYDRTVS